MALPEPPIVEADGDVEAAGGEAGELEGDLAHPGPSKVAQGDADEFAGPHPPEQPVQAFDILPVEPRRRPLHHLTQLGLGPRPGEPARAGGPAQEAGLAGEQGRDHAGGPAEEQEGVEQVALHGKGSRSVQVPLQPREAKVRIGGALHPREEGVEVVDALREPREPLLGVLRARGISGEALNSVGGRGREHESHHRSLRAALLASRPFAVPRLALSGSFPWRAAPWGEEKDLGRGLPSCSLRIGEKAPSKKSGRGRGLPSCASLRGLWGGGGPQCTSSERGTPPSGRRRGGSGPG